MATLPSDHISMDSIPQLTDPNMQQESIPSLDQSQPQPRQSPTKRVKSSDAPKMTQSCTRCRQKKLKCDSQVPCNGCISRGLEAECQKEVALKRGRAKRPRLEDGSTAPKKTEKEVETLRKRLVELEEKLEAKNEGSRQVPHQGSSKDQTNSPQVESLSSSSRILDLNPSYNRGAFGYPSSSHSSTVETPSLIHTNSNRSPDSHYVQERPSQSPVDRSSIESPPHLRPQAFHVEASASILENFASSSHRGPSLPLPRIPALSIFSSKIHVSDLRDDQQNSYWARSESLARRLEFIKEARASIPEPMVLEEMLRIFWLRCNHICSHVVNRVRSSRAIALFMSKPTVEDILMEPSFIDPSALSVTLLILLLAAKFYPENPGKASRSELDKDGRPSSAFQAVHKFLRSQGDVQSTWHRLAKEGLAIEHSYELTSSPAIVSACLLIVLGRDQQSYLKMLLDLAIRSAQAMNFHMLGEGMAPLEEEGDVRGNGNWEERRRRHLEAVIRREESCRIWWFLASRDWTFGQRDSTYRIHPSQFNTSHPLNLEDEDLSMGINSAEKEEKWTEMTYPIAQIKLSEIIRLSIDLKNEAHSHFFGSNTWSAASCQVLHSALNNFLRDLPSFYRVDAPLGTVPPITNIQRYLLHLQAFDLLLKVHRHNLGDTEGRKSCLSLANIMLTTQQTMRTICPVIDSFKINTTHTFSAAVVIIIDLLLSGDSQGGYRREARERVSKALLCLQRSPESQRAVKILQALLEVEEKQALSSSPPEERTKALMELSKRLVDLSEGESLFSPTSSSKPMTPDETVAPGLASPWNIQTPDQMAASMWIRGDDEHDLKTSSADFHLPPLLSFPSRDVRTSSPSLFSLEKGDGSGGDWESHWSRSSQPQSRSQPQTQPQPQPQRQWSHMDTLSSFSQSSHPSDSHQYAYGGNQTFQHQRDNASHSHSPSNAQQPQFHDSQTHQQYSCSSYMPQTNENWNSRS